MIVADYRDYDRTDSLSGGVWTIYNTNPQTAQYTPAKRKTTVVVYRKPAPKPLDFGQRQQPGPIPARVVVMPVLRWMARCLARR